MADKDVPYHAEWAENLTHRRDPNRVSNPEPSPPNRLPEAAPYPAAGHDSHGAEPSYYNISMLKAPLWGWEISSYFFLGGVATASYLISRAARWMGRGTHKDVERAGAYLSLLAMSPSAPLLIHDLGDPKRFHHMMRVWKPSSPMNLGTWAMTAFSGIAASEAARQFLSGRESLAGVDVKNFSALLNDDRLLALRDTVGVPMALLVAGYTGVLLSCTANPLWCQNPWLSPLFMSSAISTGAEALTLTLDLTSKTESPAQKALQRIDTAAHVVEGAALAGFMKHAGKKAEPLITGKQAKFELFAVGAIVTAEVLKLLPVPEKMRKPVRMVAAALGLAGAFAMRWAMIHGGHDAANDPRTARLVSKPRPVNGAQPA